MNHSFNRDRSRPFSSNNGPVLQRDRHVDYIMASDVLYVGTQQGTCCFQPSSDICRGQYHENLPHLVAFGIRPWAADCSWPSRSVIPSFVKRCIYCHCPELSLVLFSSQAWYIYTLMQYVVSSIQNCYMNLCLLRINNWVTIPPQIYKWHLLKQFVLFFNLSFFYATLTI